MTYSAGQTIVATDYNGFVSTNASANVNDVWAAGATDKGWGQTALGTVSAAGTITATQWASLVNTFLHQELLPLLAILLIYCLH
jgi:hypothetical protein